MKYASDGFQVSYGLGRFGYFPVDYLIGGVVHRVTKRTKFFEHLVPIPFLSNLLTQEKYRL